jgi:hypothetical protein
MAQGVCHQDPRDWGIGGKDVKSDQNSKGGLPTCQCMAHSSQMIGNFKAKTKAGMLEIPPALVGTWVNT